MSGFIGYLNGTNAIDHAKTLDKMMATIIHRGPDGGGIYTDEKVSLGFRRLKVIDLSEAANQPLVSDDGKLVLVCDNRIYNFQQLREHLKQKGYTFKSKSDSEVLLYGYQEYGFEVVKQLRGMFALCIWDKLNDTVFLARDGFGIKPLYYTHNTKDNTFIFGSEIKAFLPHPAFIKELNKNALRPYLTFQYSAMDETFFKGVFKLPPAHYLVIKNGQTKIIKYWDKKFHVKEAPLAEYVEQIHAGVKEAVEAYRMDDPEVGAFLSGGIDSSYVTALLKPKKTFSIGFTGYEGIFNETNLAKDLSEQLEIQNIRKCISADDFFAALPNIQYHMDEPQSNLSAVPLYFLAELASKEVKVVFSGEGADEIFGGYPWYKYSKDMNVYEKIPYFIRRAIFHLVKKLPKNRLTQFLVRGGQPIEERFIGNAIVFTEQDALNVLKSAYKRGPSVHSITKNIYDQVKGEDDLTKMQYLDFHLWQPGDILLKADRMSMAHSLEVRVPFLDHKIMEMAKNIPAKYRVKGTETKYALRQAAYKVLPKEWATRPKSGFMVPLRDWLREEKCYHFVKEMFSADFAQEFFEVDQLLAYLDEHYQGQKNRARYIYTAYVFLVWYKRYFIDM